MVRRIRPERVPSANAWWRWGNVLHVVFNIALPFALLILVRINLESVAIILVLASKWRVFTVKPRHLVANVRANMTDFLVKLGSVIFIIQADSPTTQMFWTIWYAVWLTLIKPRTSKAWMGVQALLGQAIGLSAVFQFSESLSQWMLLVLVWIVAFSSARHFMINYDEPWSQVIIHLWALFATQLGWILYKWTLLFGFVPQIVLILTALSYPLASMFDAAYNDNLKKSFIRQQIIMTLAILLVIILQSEWSAII